MCRSDPIEAPSKEFGLIAQALKRLGWTEQELIHRPKGHPAKVELAQQLRSQTTMPMAWVAERLSMGSRGYLTCLLQKHKPDALPAPKTPGQAMLPI